MAMSPAAQPERDGAVVDMDRKVDDAKREDRKAGAGCPWACDGLHTGRTNRATRRWTAVSL
jgi:hypothetical protein